jgi:hypothetical protein
MANRRPAVFGMAHAHYARMNKSHRNPNQLKERAISFAASIVSLSSKLPRMAHGLRDATSIC